MTADLKIAYSKTGAAVPVINGVSLHSRYAPEDEGRKLAEKFLENNAGAEIIAVFGLGFGYHILPLLSENKKIIVFEPVPELYEAYPKNEIRKKCFIATDLNAITKERNYGVFALPSVKRLFPDKFEKFVKNLENGRSESEPINISQIKVLIDSPIYGGSSTTSRYVKNAFEKLGTQVKFIDNSSASELLHLITGFEDKDFSGISALKLTELMSDILLHEVEKYNPHLVFINAQSPITKDALREIKKQGIITVIWFVEDYKRFGYWRDYASLFDYFFGIQKGEFPVFLQRFGCENYSYLPMAADDSIHKKAVLPANEKKYFGSDVSFMGAPYPNRVRLFSELSEFDLKLWGTGWEKFDSLKQFAQKNGETVSIEESVKIYSSSKININLHSSFGNDIFEKNGDFLNPRLFEIAACGGFQLTDNRSLLAEIFEPGKEIITFDSVADLKEKIRYYLEHEKERQSIADKARKKVLTSHTYKLRIKEIIYKISAESPEFGAKIIAEEKKWRFAEEKIQDPQLKRFLQTLRPNERYDIDLIMNKIKNNRTGAEYESILEVLDTFTKNL
ncbi:MAG: hypothetical protein CSB55_03905 [Candidatus Cloacimonadota bacterium]|nr:MAG: hypothetical protein CSB55_03905 [Candidatus Cloacimonadota bacterium]